MEEGCLVGLVLISLSVLGGFGLYGYFSLLVLGWLVVISKAVCKNLG